MAIELIDKITQKNGGTFPLVDAAAVEMPGGKRLSDFFGEETVTVLDQTLQYLQIDDDGDGVNDKWDSGLAVADTSGNTLIPGKTYTVTWNGAVYELECAACESVAGLPAIGDASLFGGDSNSIPFAIARDAAGVMGYGPCWAVIDYSLLEDTPLTDSGIRTCKIEVCSVKTLDSKYLPMDYITGYIDKYINEALGGEY